MCFIYVFLGPFLGPRIHPSASVQNFAKRVPQRPKNLPLYGISFGWICVLFDVGRFHGKMSQCSDQIVALFAPGRHYVIGMESFVEILYCNKCGVLIEVGKVSKYSDT